MQTVLIHFGPMGFEIYETCATSTTAVVSTESYRYSYFICYRGNLMPEAPLSYSFFIWGATWIDPCNLCCELTNNMDSEFSWFVTWLRCLVLITQAINAIFSTADVSVISSRRGYIEIYISACTEMMICTERLLVADSNKKPAVDKMKLLNYLIGRWRQLPYSDSPQNGERLRRSNKQQRRMVEEF